MARKRKLFKFRFRLIVAEEYQPILSVPRYKRICIWFIIFLALFLHVSLTMRTPPPKAGAIDLPSPFSKLTMTALSLGDPVTFGKASMLWLQAFDNQQGQSVSFSDLDYNKVANWLRAIIYLDERAQYPIFSAARIYTKLPDKEKERVRIMLNLVREQFLLDPSNRWEWMATAVTLMKNELEDLPTAVEMATELREKTEQYEHVPNWAKQMELFLREENNEYEDSAQLFLNLLDSGEITDPQEFSFLYSRLEQLFIKMIDEHKIESREQYFEMEKTFEKIRQRYLEIAEQSEQDQT